jgi:hypothetical protein
MTLKTLFALCIAALLLGACGGDSPSSADNTNSETTELGEAKTTEETAPAAPAEKTAESKIQEADAMMAEIEGNKAEQQVEKKRYMNPAQDMGHDQSIYEVYMQDGKMVKLNENKGESMYLADATYYYSKGEIFLIHTVRSFDDNVYDESMVYFEGGKPYAAMGRSKGEQDFDTDLKSVEIEKQELSKAIYDMDEYMKSLAALPTRLEASTAE